MYDGRWLIRLVVLAVAALTLGPSSNHVGAQTIANGAGSETAIAEVDGRSFSVVSGDTVAQGRLVAEGDAEACIMPETTLSVSGDASTPSISVQAEVTQDCRLQVSSIAKQPTAETSGVTSSAATRYQSGGWYDHSDVIGILLTESYAHMYYYDNGSSVYSGHQQLTYCYNARDGWYGNWADQNWNPNGPSSLWIWKWCNFSFTGGTFTHTLDVTVYSFPGNQYSVSCNHWGSTAPGARFNCQGRHWAA